MADRTLVVPNRARTPPNDGRRLGGLTSSPRPKVKDSSNTLCRNITIYGYCRFEGKGCAFNHDPQGQKQQATNGNSLGRGKFNVDSPSFTPSTPPKNLMSPKAADAAPFTPKGGSVGTATPPVQPNFHDAANSYLLQQAVDPQQTYSQNLQHAFETIGLSENSGTASINPYEYPGGVTASGQVNPYVQGHGDLFYQPTQNYQIPLQYHLYAPTAPYPQKLLPYQKNIHNFFLSDNLREELQRKGEATLQTMPNVSSLLPPQINEYHSLVPLDTSNQKSTQCFSYASWVYKAFSQEDGNTYAIRRVEGFRLSNESDIRVIQRWKKVTCANIVTIHNAWTTGKFGDSSIVFVYDYHPLSKTLAEAHFGPNPIFASGRPVPENVMWSYIVQMTSALKTIHTTGLSAKIIDLSKVLLTSKMRIRLNCCGMLDVIRPDQRPLEQQQQEDFISLGRMMLAIACGNPMAIHNYAKSIEYVGKQYSTHLRDAIYFLLSGQIKSVDKFAESIASYTLQNFNSALHYEDTLESGLTKEIENGRLARLLCKFGFINERPEFDHDPRWSETGDRYYIKLFRDYVFHSVDENGNPVVDIAHVLTCLNKLDAGVDEKVMLVSRDSLNCFVVTYKDLKRQIEATFQELVKYGRR